MKKLSDIFSRPLNLALFVAAVSIIALGSALIMQYQFNILPCHLCYEQRKPYWATIPLGILAALLAKKWPRASLALLLLAGAAFLVNMGISFFHIGVEQKWWNGLVGCGGEGATLPEGASIEELKKYLANRPIVRCDVPGFVLFGISLTGYNFLLSTFMTVFTFFHTIKGIKREKAAPKA